MSCYFACVSYNHVPQQQKKKVNTPWTIHSDWPRYSLLESRQRKLITIFIYIYIRVSTTLIAVHMNNTTNICVTPGDKAVLDFLAFPYGPVPPDTLDPLDCILASTGHLNRQPRASIGQPADESQDDVMLHMPTVYSQRINSTHHPTRLIVTFPCSLTVPKPPCRYIEIRACIFWWSGQT